MNSLNNKDDIGIAFNVKLCLTKNFVKAQDHDSLNIPSETTWFDVYLQMKSDCDESEVDLSIILEPKNGNTDLPQSITHIGTYDRKKLKEIFTNLAGIL